MNPHQQFRNRLLAAEPDTGDRRRRIQQEIQQMLTRQITLPHRIVMSLVLVAGLAGAGVCGYLAVTEARLPVLARIGLATGTLFGVAWAVVMGSMLRRGVLDVKRDTRRTAQMVWIFTVLMVVFFLMVGMSAEDRLLGLMMIAQALVFLIMAAVHWISYRIEDSEHNLKEQLLRLELQLADLTRKS